MRKAAMGMVASAERVQFPFAQALPAARALWQLSLSIINDVEPARQKAAGTALQEFRGNYSVQFQQRMTTSASNASTVAHDVQQAAVNIAQAWADAEHQQQVYNYYAMVQDKKDQKSWLEGVGDWIAGDHTDYGSPPGAPAVPSAPDFAPTAVPQASVPGEAAAVLR
jgi:hypothetical protein